MSYFITLYVVLLMFRLLFTVAKGIGLCFSILAICFSTGSIIFMVSCNILASAIVTQSLFLILSIIFAKYVLKRSMVFLGFQQTKLTLPIVALTTSILISSIISLTAVHVVKVKGPYSPLPHTLMFNIIGVLMLMIIAPICEETLFRGLLLGYLLENNVSSWTAIAASSTLFALIHLLPFHQAPLNLKASILLTAFLLGTIAGYLRRRTNSIIPAITTHMGFNLGGYIISILA